jgi:hypothetical protein
MKKKEQLKKRIAHCHSEFNKHGLRLELVPTGEVLDCDIHDRKEVLADGPYFYVMGKGNDYAGGWAGFQSLKDLENYLNQVPGRNVTIFVPDSLTETMRVTNIGIVKKAFEE